jgi:transcriptional regulator with XRE-family HTH domain
MAPKSASPVDRHVGSRIRFRRTLVSMSQEKLGEHLGITFQQIQKYEKGTNRVSASRLQDIARVLDVPVTFFFDGQDGEAGAHSGTGLGMVEQFLTGRDSIDLVRAFNSLEDRAVRRALVDLAVATANAIRSANQSLNNPSVPRETVDERIP